MSLLAHPLSPRTSSAMVFDVCEGIATQTSLIVDRPFVCAEPGCGRRFNRKFTLTEHKKTHTGEKPYVCPLSECSRRFSTSGNLARHKRLHASLKPFECNINGCKRSFPSQEKLDHHIKIHTGRRTHVCRFYDCTKTFSTAGNLTRHVKNHHPELNRNAYPSYQYVRTSPEYQLVLPPHDSPVSSAARFHAPFADMIPAVFSPDPVTKIESVPVVYSPDSVMLSPFYNESSLAFQMTNNPPVQSFSVKPRGMDPMLEATVSDIACCSMDVLDVVIQFELTKNM